MTKIDLLLTPMNQGQLEHELKYWLNACAFDVTNANRQLYLLNCPDPLHMHIKRLPDIKIQIHSFPTQNLCNLILTYVEPDCPLMPNAKTLLRWVKTKMTSFLPYSRKCNKTD